MLHPVGNLPAAVYWRRRLLVLALVLAVLGGAGRLLYTALTGGDDGGTAEAAATTSARPTPALERVLPSVDGVRTPTPPPPATEPAAGGPAAGGPCTDEMLDLEVRTPGSTPVGSKPTFELLVRNVSAVPCVRTLDKGLQELVLLDAAGARVWGSNDCFPEQSADVRTLAPGEVLTFPVVWGGLTSEPSCTAARVPPAPGAYVVRGRLDTKTTPDAPLTLS